MQILYFLSMYEAVQLESEWSTGTMWSLQAAQMGLRAAISC